MLEKLEGRLKWERTGQGIRVELPAPLDWPNIRLTAFQWVFMWFLIHLAIWIQDRFHETLFDIWLSLISLAFFLAGGIWAILRRRTILTLTPNEMTLNYGILEIGLNRRVFANSRLHDLYYSRPWKGPAGERQPGKIYLRGGVGNRIITIMSGVTEEEATTLIERMMAIYKFPNSNEAESAAAVAAG